MADVNNCTFTGRLTRDAERKTLPTGTVLVTFDMAINTGWGDYAKTLFLTVNVWGKQGENIQQYLTKGKLVGATGELEVQQWVSQKDGTEHKKNVLGQAKVTLLSTGQKSDQPLEKDAEPYDPEGDVAF